VLTGNTQFESELKKRIAEEIERLQDILETGMSIKDYADYKHHVGQIQALRRVVESYCDDVTTKINEQR
jgi:uncharacterized protein (UPF0276 family)